MAAQFFLWLEKKGIGILPTTPELNPSAQSCLPNFFTGDFNF
jgi:hypothetical protein